ncbi:MAG: hydroxymethylbilane synthase [Maricaulaceae bacterium]
MTRPLIIGTRGSPLALWQARWVQSLLAAGHEANKDQLFPIKTFTTSGDTLKGDLKDFGGKGLFTKELEQSLIDGDIDMAVHSMKDVPTQSQEGLSISTILPRADHRDGFISKKYGSIDELPQGALVGTASIRRRAQLSALRPDVRYTLLRGNVGTRLAKLEAGVCDATFLACAGLKRLGQGELITETIDVDRMLNAPAQGAVGVETRVDNGSAKAALAALHDYKTAIAVFAERGFLEGLDGSCRTPIAALAEIRGEELFMRGEVLSLSGAKKYTASLTRPVQDMAAARLMGLEMAKDIRAQVGDLDSLFNEGDS